MIKGKLSNIRKRLMCPLVSALIQIFIIFTLFMVKFEDSDTICDTSKVVEVIDGLSTYSRDK
jgi:hypothetical protein